MFRIFLSLVLIALAIAGAAWIAGQTGGVALSFGGWHIETTPPVFAMAIFIMVVAVILIWTLIRALWLFSQPGQ